MLNQDLTAVKQIQRLSIRCSLSVGSDEVDLGAGLRLYSCMLRVVLRIWSCRVTEVG
jgi:hypothetical protein